MLTAGQINNVSFKVNVMGSSMEPTVRLVLACNPDMSFAAVRDGDSWKAVLNIPTSVQPGSYDMRVEVVLNNRLFTPLYKKVDITAAPQEATNEPAEVMTTPPVPPAPAEVGPQPEPEVHDEPSISLISTIALADEPTKKPAPAMPKVVAKLPKIEPKAEPAYEHVPVELPPAPPLSKLAEVTARKPKRMFERIVTPLPQGDVEIKPITISISEVNAMTATTTKKTMSAKPAVEVKKNAAVRLVKEELFYE